MKNGPIAYIFTPGNKELFKLGIISRQIERFSIECRKNLGNYFSFGFSTVLEWLSSLIGK